jgi:tryptophanyl-tRNA synthetase
LYDADIVPVGKDQLQHLEIARDIAGVFNRTYGETFVIPKASIREDVMIVPGIDGQKMSKSYQNTIQIFQSDSGLKKNINKIITGSEPLEAPKNPESCTVFQLYTLLSDAHEQASLRAQYLGGNFGYGAAKTILFERIMDRFSRERAEYDRLMQHTPEIETILLQGADKARGIASSVLRRVRDTLGFSTKG